MTNGRDHTGPISILMISHHRRFKAQARSHVMAQHLGQRGHHVTLLLTANERRFRLVESDWDGIRIVEAPDLLWGRLRSGWDLWNLLHRMRFLNRDGASYDLIHCFETRPATIYPALAYRKRHKLPLITDWNDWWGRGGLIVESRPRLYRILFGGIETYYEEAFRRRADGLTVISSALAERAVGLGVPRDSICYLPGGALPTLFQARSKEICRQRVGLDPEGPVLGFSSMDSYLDIEIVMKAMAILRRRYPRIRLLVTGIPSENLNEAAIAHGLEDNLHLTGFLPMEELPWHLGCADVFLLPFPEKIYNIGRWPNKIGEYMSLGRPTVSNPVGEIKELFDKHRVGLLAAFEPKDFALKISQLLEDPALASELGDNARRVAVDEYDWGLLVERLEGYYYQVLNRTQVDQLQDR